MAKQAQVEQSTEESKIYPLDFSPALLEGVELLDVLLTYTGDNAEGSPPVFSLVAIDGSIAYVSLSGLEIGNHRLSVIAETDNTDLSPEIMLLISTKF